MATLIFVAAFLGAKLGAEPRAPAGLLGAWEVDHVAVDEQDQMHWGTRPDDPELLGRELLIQADTIHFTADEAACKQTAWKPQSLTWAKLFAKSFSRAPGYGRTTIPSPADFGVKVKPSEKATFFQICPVPGLRSSDALQSTRWVVQREPDALVMHYDNQVLLTLRRRPAGEKPRASFDCQKAATPTESVICGSYALSSWDRSVAAAFRNALKGSPEAEAALREEQRTWLKSRDACGLKEDCINELLWRRVEDLRHRLR